ncbi:hypothetical protein RJ641_013553 [Dillenia turbinata]|uniref:Uncharacterized protein n=1 Tax=Dillenia turbinata TaxID=194707 RepID=A0AAN8WA84_9MAGN
MQLSANMASCAADSASAAMLRKLVSSRTHVLNCKCSSEAEFAFILKIRKSRSESDWQQDEGFWILGFLLVAASAFVVPLSSLSASTPSAESNFKGPKDSPTSAGAVARRPEGKSSTGGIVLEDYHPIEAAPSTRAAITSGPIEHGTPIIPYIPRTAPPNVPKHSASPSPAKSPMS